MRNRLFLLLLLLLFGSRQPIQAQLLFSLNPAAQSGPPGSTITFNATLTNARTDTLFLNGDSANVFAPGLTFDDTLFFNNFPFSLAGGDAVTADLFQVTIAPGTPAGDYLGNFTVIGGADDTAQDNLATQNFLVTVLAPAAVPEPGALAWLIATVGLGLSYCRLRRRQ